ncbi:MAG: PAS domain S-box protein [Candidatus Manganitrophaceae bacterium]|nr:MAG: PAS domain S-box protein [Candidatus Manganitrophaceae bacterium]
MLFPLLKRFGGRVMILHRRLQGDHAGIHSCNLLLCEEASSGFRSAIKRHDVSGREAMSEKSGVKRGAENQGREDKRSERLPIEDNNDLIRSLQRRQVELEAQNRELRQIQSELEADRNRYSDLYDFSPVGYFTLNPKGLIVEANLKAALLLGIARDRLLKTSFSLYLPKEARLSFMAYLKQVFKKKCRQSCRLRLRRRNTSVLDVQVESLLVENAHYGAVCRMALSDRTDLPGTGETVRDSEEKYRLLFERNPHPVWLFDLETLAFLEANEAAIRHYGYSRQEFLSMTLQAILPREATSVLLRELFHVQSGVKRTGVWRHLKKDGTLIEVEIMGEIISFSGRRAGMVVATDVTQRSHTDAALRESERRFRALIENSSDAIALLSSNGKIFYASPSTLRIFGYTPEALLGKTPLELIHPDHRERARSLFSDLMKRPGEGAVTELQFRHRDGAWHWVEGIGTNLLHDPSVRAIVINYRDITDRKEAEAALQEKNLRIEEASRARNRFFSYMSHELKTPVNSIVGFTQLLKNGTYGPLTPKQLGAVGRIHNNSGELIHLINNILDMAKLESGKKRFEVMEVPLQELAEKVLISFEPLLQEKGLSLQKEIDPDLPERFLTDPMQVRSILTNLLSNAVKFTEKGGVRLRLSREGKGVLLEVSDTGAGISVEYLDRIFDEYEQRGVVREAKGNYTGGSGLGLAIVKKMVDLLGGWIEVASAPGEGAVFTVFIPEASTAT